MLKTENSLVDKDILSFQTYLRLEHHCVLSDQDIWNYLLNLDLTPSQRSKITQLIYFFYSLA